MLVKKAKWFSCGLFYLFSVPLQGTHDGGHILGVHGFSLGHLTKHNGLYLACSIAQLEEPEDQIRCLLSFGMFFGSKNGLRTCVG
jgi:hypothetical protein